MLNSVAHVVVFSFVFFYAFLPLPPHPVSGMCDSCWPPRDLPQDLCPVYRPGEWEQLPSEHELNPFSRYEALVPKQPIVLDDIKSTLSETGETISNARDPFKQSYYLDRIFKVLFEKQFLVIHFFERQY